MQQMMLPPRIVQGSMEVATAMGLAIGIAGLIFAFGARDKNKKEVLEIKSMLKEIIANQNLPAPKDPKKSRASGNEVKPNHRIRLQVFNHYVTSYD